MLTGVAADVLDTLLRGEPMACIPKKLRAELLALHAAREQGARWDSELDEREQAVMARVEAHIIKKLWI